MNATANTESPVVPLTLHARTYKVQLNSTKSTNSGVKMWMNFLHLAISHRNQCEQLNSKGWLPGWGGMEGGVIPPLPLSFLLLPFSYHLVKFHFPCLSLTARPMLESFSEGLVR